MCTRRWAWMPQLRKLQVRRRRHEELRRDYWRDWFASDPQLFTAVYERNRETLASVGEWVSDETYWNSFSCYGVPERSRPTLADVEAGVSYSDLILFIAKKLPRLTYLEIGVSVGKNLLQMMNGVENADLWGLDIERINPLLEEYLDEKKVVWEGRSESPYTRRRDSQTRVKTATLTEYRHAKNRNQIHYLSGDKLEPETWTRLEGVPFNLIFSDACHTVESIRSELGFLRDLGCYDRDDFVMLWDDLQRSDMREQFAENCESLAILFRGRRCEYGLYEIFGTYGARNGRPHTIGIFWLA